MIRKKDLQEEFRKQKLGENYAKKIFLILLFGFFGVFCYSLAWNFPTNPTITTLGLFGNIIGIFWAGVLTERANL